MDNCSDVWGGLFLTEEEAQEIVTVAVAKTAVKLKFLHMYQKILEQRNAN